MSIENVDYKPLLDGNNIIYNMYLPTTLINMIKIGIGLL